MFVTQEMCDKAVVKYSWLLKHVPDWFVTQEQMDLWGDDNDNKDKFFEWYDGYKK